MNALIIDDSKAMRRILKGIMKGFGFEVAEAEHGQEGVDQLVENNGEFEVVLVDWNMPVMNGLEFVEYARAKPEFADLKIVMVTTETEPARMVKALMTGVDEFVMKPFTPEMLIDKLKLIGVQGVKTA